MKNKQTKTLTRSLCVEMVMWRRLNYIFKT